MRGADQLFRIGTLAVLETRLESIRRLLEHARLGGDGAAAVLDVALPNCPCLLDHDRSASCVLRGTRNGRNSSFAQRLSRFTQGLALSHVTQSGSNINNILKHHTWFATSPSWHRRPMFAMPSARPARAPAQHWRPRAADTSGIVVRAA